MKELKDKDSSHLTPPGVEIRTYWMSFASPADGKNLGVIITSVSKEEADAALSLHPKMYDRAEGPWVVAAVRKAHKLGINPGGEVAAYRLDHVKDFRTVKPFYPEDKLLSKKDIEVSEKQAKAALMPAEEKNI